MIGTGESGLLTALHHGIFETPYWRQFLAQLRTIMQADYVSLVFRRPDARVTEVRLMYSGDNEPQSRLDYVEELNSKSPLPYDDIPPGKVYELSEIVDLSNPIHRDYKEYMAGRLLNYVIGVRIVEPGGGSAWLAVGREKGSFREENRALLAQLAPHMNIAAQSLASIERERMRADIAADAVTRLNFGWVTLDARATILEINGEAERVFQTTQSLPNIAVGQPLRLGMTAQRSLVNVLADFRQSMNVSPRAIHLVDDPWLDMLVKPISYRTTSGGVTPLAVAYVHREGSVGADRYKLLMELFSLTRSEALLALALSRGKSIAEAAAELNLTVETARNYSKRIYAKTATRSQADVVRLILASVIALN